MSSYREIFDLHFKVLKFLGLWNIKTCSALNHQLYFFYQCFSIFFVSSFNVLILIDLYLMRHDIENFNYNLCVAVPTSVNFLKTLMALRKLPDINRLNKSLRRDVIEEQDEECRERIRKAAWEMNFLNKLYYTMNYVLITIWCLIPLFDYKSGARKLPFRQWFPFDFRNSPVYELVYVYQIIAAVVISSSLAASDLATYGFMIRIAAEYDILKGNLEKLNGIYEVVEDDVDERKRDEETLKIVRSSVVHHQEIIQRTRELEEVYNKTLMFQFLGCTVLLAVVGVDLTVLSKEFNTRFMTQLVYLSVCMTNLFFYCIYGTRLEYKSYDIAESAFHAPWYLMKSKFRCYLSLMIAKAQEPPIVTGGKILAINFKAFLKVLKTTYNMLMLFRQVALKTRKLKANGVAVYTADAVEESGWIS